MVSNNLKPASSPGGVDGEGGGGESALDTGDWRTQLPSDARQGIVDQIMNTLKKHPPVSGQEEIHELKKLAIRLEEEIYTDAVSQSDYFQKISLKVPTMETNSQNPMANSLSSNHTGSSNKLPDPASPDSTAQTGHTNGGDWQEEVHQKIKVMKETHLSGLNEVYQKITTKLQQSDSLPQQPTSDQLGKMKQFKNILERIIAFLQISKSKISPDVKEKLGLYEKQILNVISVIRRRKSVSSSKQGELPPSHTHSMQQPLPQVTHIQSEDNQMNPQLPSMNLQGSVATMLQHNMTNLHHNFMSSLSGLSVAQQNMMDSLQPGSNLDSGQENALSSLQQVAKGCIQQNPANATQQANANTSSTPWDLYPTETENAVVATIQTRDSTAPDAATTGAEAAANATATAGTVASPTKAASVCTASDTPNATTSSSQ